MGIATLRTLSGNSSNRPLADRDEPLTAIMSAEAR